MRCSAALSPTVEPHPATDDAVDAVHDCAGRRHTWRRSTGSDAPLTRSLQPKPSDDLSSFARRLGTTDEELAAYTNDGRRRRTRGPTSSSDAPSSRARTDSSDEQRSVVPRRRDAAPCTASSTRSSRRPGRRSTSPLGTGWCRSPFRLAHRLSRHDRPVPARRQARVPGPRGRPHPSDPDRGDDTRVPINVRTRASGDSALDVTLQTRTAGSSSAAPASPCDPPRSPASGVVLSVGAGTFLALWWGRHIVTARRARRRPRHAAT